MIYTTQDCIDLARCGWMEDRSAGIGGCFLVMCVIYNRFLAPGFPKSIHAVIYSPNAFSWTRPDDPEYGKQPAKDDPVYLACLSDAPTILAGTNDDPTKGALFYANEAEVGSGWYRDHIINSTEHPTTLTFGKLTYRK